MNERQRESRWQLIESEGPPHGGLFELEIETTYRIVDRRTGAIVLERTGIYEASFGDHGNWDEGTTTGVVKLEISADDRAALIHHADGTLERLPLPD
jgi:hypothetical protein